MYRHINFKCVISMIIHLTVVSHLIIASCDTNQYCPWCYSANDIVICPTTQASIPDGQSVTINCGQHSHWCYTKVSADDSSTTRCTTVDFTCNMGQLVNSNGQPFLGCDDQVDRISAYCTGKSTPTRTQLQTLLPRRTTF
jgi:hypothetical protein